MSAPTIAVVMPYEIKDIIHILIKKHGFTINSLAKQLSVSARTIYRIKAGNAVSDQLIGDIVALYCRYAL